MLFLKVLLTGVFSLIAFQDYKGRLVFWFLYPLCAILAFAIQAAYVGLYMVMAGAALNLAFVSVLVCVCWLYSGFKLKRPFLEEVLGPGDILLFYALCFTFSTISFCVLFVFALIFSLLLHLVFEKRQEDKTVPLAGYMSLFFGVVYLIGFICGSGFLYAY